LLKLSIKKEIEKENPNKIRDERGDITTDTTQIQRNTGE
jgi:hypothetical protein